MGPTTTAGPADSPRPASATSSSGGSSARTAAAVAAAVLFALAAPRAPRPTLSSPFEIEYARTLGGTSTEIPPRPPAAGLAIDRDGSVYVAGSTASLDFPLRDPWQHGRQGPFDAFVVKLDGRGRTVYATYLGGSLEDYGHAIAVDRDGNTYVAGETRSDDFPGEPPPEGGAFVVKLDPQGFVAYARFVARGPEASADAIAVDADGDPHVAGRTGDGDAFVTALDAQGQTVATVRLGGSGDDRATGIAVDAAGTVHVVGLTTSADFPTAGRAASPCGGGTAQLFLATLRRGAPAQSTCLADRAAGTGPAVALDVRGDVYIAGATSAGAFVEKRHATGARVYRKTFGAPSDAARAIAVDAEGRAHVVGVAGAPGDAFLAVLAADGSRLRRFTSIGGRRRDRADGIALAANGAALLVGTTESEDFPVAGVAPTVPAAYAGDGDAFVVRLAPAREINAD